MNSKVNFQAINNDILLELPVVDKKTKSGIIKSPSMVKEEESNSDKFYPVISVGEGCKFIKEGDRVYVTGKHQQIELDGKLYALVNEIHVLGKRKD